MEDNKKIILKALELLRQIKTNDSDINIEAETGYDEATFIGTDKGFIALSKYLLEFVHAFYNHDEHFIVDEETDYLAREIKNIPCFTSGSLYQVFNDTGEVFPVCAVITKDEKDKDIVVQAFK